jgi:hypothetical protein
MAPRGKARPGRVPTLRADDHTPTTHQTADHWLHCSPRWGQCASEPPPRIYLRQAVIGSLETTQRRSFEPPRAVGDKDLLDMQPQAAFTPVYHRTAQAFAILTEGFRDGLKVFQAPVGERWGVWVSLNFPLDENEGARGDDVIVIEIPTDLFDEYEVIEEKKPYRESFVPAQELNVYLASVRILSDDELDEIESRHRPPPRTLTDAELDELS